VLVTAIYLNLALGLVGGLAIYVSSNFLLAHFANLTPDLATEAKAAMPWVACMMPVGLISGIGTGAIESRERFLTSNMLQTFGGLVGQIAPLICALLIGPSLAVVIPAAFCARLLSTCVIWFFVIRLERPVDLRQFDRRMVRQLLGYGAWVTVSSGISPLLETFDQMLIAGLLGPASIAHYAVPMNLATRSQGTGVGSRKNPLPPALASRRARGESSGQPCDRDAGDRVRRPLRAGRAAGRAVFCVFGSARISQPMPHRSPSCC